jgi:K+-transporting ATPase ATPase C chain
MMRTLPGQLLAALRLLLVFTVVLGLGYPLVIAGIGQTAFHDQANGSLLKLDGKVVGSSLIGQAFTDAKGAPLPQYFQSRPSKAGDGYDPTATAASNLGPESVTDAPDKPGLLTQVCTRSHNIGTLDGVSGTRPYCGTDGGGTPNQRGTASSVIPGDAVTASGSGLDPDISPEYARLQAPRVARVRGLTVAAVLALVQEHVQQRTLGFLGEPRVNVLELNLALDRLH